MPHTELRSVNSEPLDTTHTDNLQDMKDLTTRLETRS